ncbi:hypothetical protein [Oricola sp.]|uniref:hypothetical protein n=1 Tax=Oricola sp. TaxID=1979950 RepID=UPI003BAB0F45
MVSDVDEVVLEFVQPFMQFLDANGHELRLESFRLHGNIYIKKTQETVDNYTVSRFLESFFAEHDDWQTVVPDAVECLAALRERHGADIVFLTAMPPRHHARRRALLDLHGLDHPMIATEEKKGDAVSALLAGNPARPVAFIDDLPHNHISVSTAAPDALTVHMTAHKPLKPLLPPLPENVVEAEDWREVYAAISAFLTERGY